MMVIAVGLSSYNVALFHLVNHAFYKGLLFLGSGALIHAAADNQDFRKYGGLRPFLPVTYTVMLIGSLSLAAVPFMTGFYSKDLILESAYGQYILPSTVIYYLALIGSMFTTLYSAKILYFTFLASPNGPIVDYQHAEEGDLYFNIPLITLAVFSIFFGYVFKDIFMGLGSGFFADNSLFIHPNHEILIDTEFSIPVIFKFLPFLFTFSFFFLSMIISEFLPNWITYFKFSKIGYNLSVFFSLRFFIEYLYNKFVVEGVLFLGGQTYKIVDKGAIEFVGPYGLEKSLLNAGHSIHNLSTGIVTSYALYIMMALIFFIASLYFPLCDANLLILILFTLIVMLNNKWYIA